MKLKAVGLVETQFKKLSVPRICFSTSCTKIAKIQTWQKTTDFLSREDKTKGFSI